MDRQTLTEWASHKTVKEAIEHLRALGHQDILIFYQGTQMNLSSLLDLDTTYWKLASRVPIHFMGGPPKKARMMCGSVQALLLDRAFRFLIHDGTMAELQRTLKIR